MKECRAIAVNFQVIVVKLILLVWAWLTGWLGNVDRTMLVDVDAYGWLVISLT